MNERPSDDRSAKRLEPEHGCWAGGCLGGPAGAILLPVAGFQWMMHQQVDVDIVFSYVVAILIPIGFVGGILLGALLGSIIYYIQRHLQRNNR